MSGWAVIADRRVPGGFHVVPQRDLREHESGAGCWCGPQMDGHADGPVWVHYAADRRDEFENGTRKPS